MTANTWNFPCYTCNDWGSFDMEGGAGGERGAHGMVWAIGPEVASSPLQPFTNTITGIFPIFLRSGWSDVSHTLIQHITSIGGLSAANWGIDINLGPGGWLNVFAYDMGAVTSRHQVQLGDEDGVSQIQADKWYQLAFSMSSTNFSYCLNGSTTPLVNVISAVDGDLNLDYGNDRWWWHAGRTANSGLRTELDNEMIFIEDGWGTYITGAAAWDTNYLDLTSATVRNRIFDEDGNFKNPGEDGSLWFGDEYGVNTPDFYFLDGSPRKDNGTYNVANNQAFVARNGGGAGSVTCTGGLRKQYENAFPDDWWVYVSLALAEASGDTWIDGDTIFISVTGGLFVYKSDLATEGYSGLIHKYPFGQEHGEVTDLTVLGSESKASDPDTWTDLTVSTGGSAGVDYVLDVDAGESRIRTLTDPGTVTCTSTVNVTSSETTTFRIIDQADITKTGGPYEQQGYHQIRAYKDGTNYTNARITQYGAGNEWHMLVSTGLVLASPGVSCDVSRRLFIYASGDYVAYWKDGDPKSLVPVGSLPYAPVEGAPPPVATTNIGTTSAGATYTAHMGIDIFGSMTIS